MPVPVGLREGGAAPYLFQMNYRGLLSYNGFFVSPILSMNIDKG